MADNACNMLLKTKKVESMRDKFWNSWAETYKKQFGKLPPTMHTRFNNGFKKGFLKSCKKRLQTTPTPPKKNKTLKKKTKK
jgi:hypothetical protein